MASSIQILRSTTARERPFAGNLLDGQPAVNLNSSEPGLFFKATDGSLVKIGPVAITSDGYSPNFNAAGSPGNSVGELWFDASQTPGVLKIYDGTTWQVAGGGGGSGQYAQLLRWNKTMAGGETLLSGLDSSGQNLQFTPGLEQVFINGVLVSRGLDYQTPNGNLINNLQPLSQGDDVSVLVWTNLSPSPTPPTSQAILKLDNLSAQFDGSTLSFPMTSSGSPVSVSDLDRLLIHIGGVLQDSGVDFTVSGTSLIFSTAPTAGLSFIGYYFS